MSANVCASSTSRSSTRDVGGPILFRITPPTLYLPGETRWWPDVPLSKDEATARHHEPPPLPLVDVRAPKSGARGGGQLGGAGKPGRRRRLALGDAAGKIAELDVHPLGGLRQHRERLVNAQLPVLGLDDADGFADDLPGLDGSAQVRLLARGVDDHGPKRGEQDGHHLVLVAEGVLSRG